jgi:hypothetical protein
MTNLLHFTINVQKIPRSTSVHFATLVRRSRVVRLSSFSPFFMRIAASKMWANSSSCVPICNNRRIIYCRFWFDRMIWYMIRCDMIYDTVWYDMMIWYDIWHDMTWYDILYDTIWYDMIWYDMIWYDVIYDMIWYDIFNCNWVDSRWL